MRPFTLGSRRTRTSDKQHRNKRHSKQFHVMQSAKLRESCGVRKSKKILRSALLNVDGLDEVSLQDIKSTVASKKPDILFLLETKRRMESCDLDAEIPGYSLHEARRSDASGDKEGGGIALYTKLSDGIIFKNHNPDIDDPTEAFVNTERVWVTLQSQSSKTALCGIYLGCQYSDDRYSTFNDTIYRVVQREAFQLRSKGYRVVFLGDFNGHVGSLEGQGVPGNTNDVNPNGRRFLDFLSITDSKHVNGDRKLTSGLWTRQRGGFSSIIDFAVVSSEHMSSVVSLLVDDHGELGGGSDHNWLILDLTDNFVKLERVVNSSVKKSRWNFSEEQDWSGFTEHMRRLAPTLTGSNPTSLGSGVSNSILTALHAEIGLKSSSSFSKPKNLPPDLVQELKIKRSLEKNWKTLNCSERIVNSPNVAAAEQLFLEQKSKVSDLLHLHKQHRRSTIIDQCKGHTPKALKNFWSYVSPSNKQKTVLSAVVNPLSGVVKCDIDEIRTEVENHLINVFEGSYDKVSTDLPSPDLSDHSYAQPQDNSVPVNPSLSNLDAGGSIETNPTGWLNSFFDLSEIQKIVKRLKNGKARGWDMIPNEALKHLPIEMLVVITRLFNLIKSSGVMPDGWNRGRVALIHKRGLREVLGNYRPITVIICLSGLYSKVLNERLMSVVEEHKLLEEIQNGFRKNRCAGDNSFILDTVIWKARSMHKRIYLAFLDISKAYDSINRDILWKKLSAIGIQGDFLATLKSIYSDDNIDCMVNGSPTRPIFLRRGLRQGCSLSPLLFALYIMDVGSDINDSKVGSWLEMCVFLDFCLQTTWYWLQDQLKV